MKFFNLFKPIKSPVGETIKSLDNHIKLIREDVTQVQYQDYLKRFAENPRGYHAVKMSSYENNIQYTNPRIFISDDMLEPKKFARWLAVHGVRLL